MTVSFTVYVVDDDAGVARALTRLIRSKGYAVRSFTSAQAFLTEHDPAIPGCVVLDLSMPGIDGIEVQAAINTPASQRPVIFVTGKGDIPSSVCAMKAGALDFLTKPVNTTALIDALARAQEIDARTRELRGELAAIETRFMGLTRREREVLERVVAGRLNKQIADDLGMAEKTVKVHRSRMMKKMGVRSVAELARLSEKAGLKYTP